MDVNQVLFLFIFGFFFSEKKKKRKKEKDERKEAGSFSFIKDSDYRKSNPKLIIGIHCYKCILNSASSLKKEILCIYSMQIPLRIQI